MHLVDPLPGQIGQSGEVLGPGQPFGLEPAHLAGRGRRPGNRPVADHPAHRRIAAQPLGVVYVLITSEPTEHRLPRRSATDDGASCQCARRQVDTQVGQAEGVIQLAIGQQSRIAGDRGATKLEHQAAIIIQPQRDVRQLTRWVHHVCLVNLAQHIVF